ncbi:CUB and sushi domain-containing protein 1-like isoform X5 [Halichondria panicea]|uniref:CUB and sushi domain-containing protein 1-like isoform X5 n=1 Tax=Halichondria panicea TaxID=6063 RepID=UPI00312B70EB
MNRTYLLEFLFCVIIIHLSRGQDFCTPFPALENGEVSQPSPIERFSLATFSCNEGYELQGSDTRACLNNGLWTGVDSSCTLVDCLPLPLLTNGDISVNTTTFMSTASYSCDLGYQLDGDVIRTCQLNGSWSGIEPVCNSIDCGPLTDPGNGLVMVSTTIFMSTAAYSCNSGYTLEGDISRTCQFNGSWSGAEPACNLVDCGPPPTLENGGPSSVTITTTVNSFVMYECNEGYLAQVAVNTISFCQADGQWSNISVTCQIVTCNRLFPPFQATISFTSMFNFGSEAIYSCITGFEIVQGSASRICQASGSWNGTQPSCERVNCGSPSSLSNGSVTVGLTTFNSLAGYGCDDGFLLDPPSQEIRSCTANRVWSGPDPTCNSVDCGFLAPPLFGSVELKQVNQTSLGAVANYACLRGYQLLGNSSRTCLANGEWSSMEPLCEVVTCNRLFPPFQATISFTSMFNFGSEAIYSCITGFEIVQGSASRICQASGSWNGTQPSCERVNCGSPSSVSNGSVTVGLTTFNSLAGYGCDDGFLLDPPSQEIRSCTANRVWSGPDPTCNPVDCGFLAPPLFGSVELKQVNQTSLGAVANYACLRGYQLLGNSSRTCLANGEWSSIEPLCEVIECPTLQNPDNGEVNIQVGINGDTTATYSCNEGYELNGNNIRNCEANLQWSGTAATCEIVVCDGLSPPVNGTLLLSSVVFNSQATYGCNSGFMINGPTVRICQQTGSWSGNIPTCEEILCPELKVSQGTINTTNGYRTSSVATVQCSNGYRLSGQSSLTCQITGEWTDNEPTCEHIDECFLPAIITLLNLLMYVSLLCHTIISTTAADNVGLYVGIAIPVGLVMIAATVIIILLLYIIHKQRAKKQQQSDVATYQATNSEYYEDINDAPIISSSTEVPSTQEPLYTTIEESTDSNSNLTESNANGDVITTDDYYYVNEGMGGINEVTMKTNKAYGTTKKLQMVANPSSVSHDPPTILNPAYGDVTTTNNSVMATDANRLSGTAEVAMIRNEAYTEVRWSNIPTTENEAYTSVTADTES